MRALDGKVVAVTGASSGSGLGVARRFVAEGAEVVLLARGRERLERVAAELGERAAAIATDVGDPDSVRATFEHIDARFGKLDVLVRAPHRRSWHRRRGARGRVATGWRGVRCRWFRRWWW